MITGSGKYVITGTLSDGYICVDANANSKVWILLNGVDISCSDNACLRVDEADKVFLTLAEGTTNTMTGGEKLSDEAAEDGTYGVIFAHDDLTVNGSGTLEINAGYKHGIKANDDLVITGGMIMIEAPADGIHVNDSFRLKNAMVDITAGDDAILTENEESFFYMESGDITVNAKEDGIHSSGNVIITGGTVTMDVGDDGIHADGDIEIEDGVIQMNSCYEGIEGTTITVSGGDITLYPTDDGFNASSGGASEGNMFGNAGNPGSMGFPGAGMQPPEELEQTAGNGQTSSDGTADTEETSVSEGAAAPEKAAVSEQAAASEEAVAPEKAAVSEQAAASEEAVVSEEATASNETVISQDGKPQGPGMAPGGQNRMNPDGTPQADGVPGQNVTVGNEQQITLEEPENFIRILGGRITIINENGMDADGLDSNGDILITGGDIRISMVDNGMNNAIDAGTEYGGVAEISGGTVIACGNNAMAEGFDSASTQCAVMYVPPSGLESGTYLVVKDEEGVEILSWEVPCSFSSAVISCPGLQNNGTCTITAGEYEETIE